ncbi:MAG: hypothetical protein KF851_19890 [Pirellulaceae bacterium]|nr:hypothetical protein [Pirellulaceae bacterium]
MLMDVVTNGRDRVNVNSLQPVVAYRFESPSRSGDRSTGNTHHSPTLVHPIVQVSRFAAGLIAVAL